MSWKPAAYELHGKLDLTNVSDLLVFLESSGKNGALGLSRGLGGKKARIYFSDGQIAHVACGDLIGLDALADILGWERGDFNFAPGVEPPRNTLEMPLQFALMEAARLRDEMGRVNQDRLNHNQFNNNGISEEFNFDLDLSTDSSDGEVTWSINEDEADEITDDRSGAVKPRPERREEMSFGKERNSTEVLDDLLKVPGVDACVVVGRDGFVIESSGSSQRLNMDALGAALAHAINGLEEMGAELRIDGFSDLFVEYGRAVLLCRPVGEAVAVLVTPDASKLGIIRHKSKALFQELGSLF